MSNFPWDQTFFGWVHLTSAAAVAGFLFVWLFALLPSGAETARAAVSRYRPVFWAAALLLPLTGAYTWHVRAGQGYPSFYFHVLYTKILLYVVLFGLAGVLTKPRETPGGLQRNARLWLGVCAALVLVILFLSAFMRRVKPEAVVTIRGPVLTRMGLAGHSGTGRFVSVVLEKGVAPGWLK